MTRKEFKPSSFSKLSIGKVNSTGVNLFAAKTGNIRSFISIDFKYAEMNNLLGSLSIFERSGIACINLTNEQWSSLLLNNYVNNDGVPCTIVFREDFHIDNCNIYEKESTNNEYKLLIDDFNQKLNKLLPINSSVKKVSHKLLQLDSNAENRKKLNELSKNCLNEWNEKQKELEILLNETFKNLDETTTQELQKDIKNDFLTGFVSSLENQEKALMLLGIENTQKLLTSDNSTEIKTLPIVKTHGILKLEEIVSNEGFVEDVDVKNGYRLTVLQAIEQIDSLGKKIISTNDEVIVSVELSVNQFADFISSFNQGGVNSTLIKTSLSGEIQKDFIDISAEFDVFNRRLDEFNTSIIDTNDKLSNINDEIQNDLKRKIGIKKVRQVEINFEQFYNKTVSNISFYIHQLLEIALNKNVSKRMDVMFNVEKTIKKSGIQDLNKRIENSESFNLLSSPE
jgi:hypothetical protein